MTSPARLEALISEKRAALDATKSDVSFGSQIRSYVFQPYTMVNDHRTELKITDVQKVMDGGIDEFIDELGAEPQAACGPVHDERAHLGTEGDGRDRPEQEA